MMALFISVSYILMPRKAPFGHTSPNNAIWLVIAKAKVHLRHPWALARNTLSLHPESTWSICVIPTQWLKSQGMVSKMGRMVSLLAPLGSRQSSYSQALEQHQERLYGFLSLGRGFQSLPAIRHF